MHLDIVFRVFLSTLIGLGISFLIVMAIGWVLAPRKRRIFTVLTGRDTRGNTIKYRLTLIHDPNDKERP